MSSGIHLPLHLLSLFFRLSKLSLVTWASTTEIRDDLGWVQWQESIDAVTKYRPAWLVKTQAGYSSPFERRRGGSDVRFEGKR